MSASVLQKEVGETIFTLSSAITLPSPFTGTTISNAFVQLDLNGGCAGVSTSVSGVLEFSECGVFDIDSQCQLLTPADISSSTGNGNILYYLAPSAGVSAQLKAGQFVEMKQTSGAAEPVFNLGGIAFVNSVPSTLTPTIGFPPGCVSVAGTGTVEISAGGATNYRVRKLL